MLLNSIYQQGLLWPERYIDILVIWAGYCLLSVTILLNRGTNNNVWWILSILLKSICKKQILNGSYHIFDMKNKPSEMETYYVPADLIKQLEFWILNLYIKLLQINCRFRIVQQICLITGTLQNSTVCSEIIHTQKRGYHCVISVSCSP